ncbi:hypothetical protein [Azospirillum isscasi]|uniref:hypothetical protein n=1 Tax=Azospirillum isscasi TaxID=3053926 RepID=UPI0027D30156|nr:hypothetical protein [Azospirillum isscasi]
MTTGSDARMSCSHPDSPALGGPKVRLPPIQKKNFAMTGQKARKLSTPKHVPGEKSKKFSCEPCDIEHHRRIFVKVPGDAEQREAKKAKI